MSESLYDLMLAQIGEAYEAGRFTEAGEQLRVALLQFPEDGRLIERQGLVWHASGDFTAAVRALETAALLVPLTISVQMVQAHSYLRIGRKTEAQTILRYLATRTDLPTPLLPQLCVGLGRVGEYQLALEMCREASLRDSESDEAVYGMAFYMSKLGYPPETVLPLLRRAFALEPHRPIYRLGLAVACARNGLMREAYDLFRGLNVEQIACVRCLDAMAQVCRNFGDKARVKACHDKVLAIETSRGTAASSRPTTAETLREAG